MLARECEQQVVLRVGGKSGKRGRACKTEWLRPTASKREADGRTMERRQHDAQTVIKERVGESYGKYFVP